MTEELKLSIERLYDKFSIYPLKSTFDGCPCCVSKTEKLKLHTKALHLLDAEDLEHYTASAMLTWGDEDDFKHFLPRIFELLASNTLFTDTFIVLGKLNSAKWLEWKTDEIEVIKTFLQTWWIDLTKNKIEFDREAFIEISRLLGGVQPLLDLWTISFDDSSFRNLIDFIYYDLQTLNTEKRIFTYKNIDALTINRINSWLINQTEMVEHGFFRFEKTDKIFSERISICYDILKGLKLETE